MEPKTKNTIYVVGAIAFTLGLLIAPQRLRAQTVTSPGTDTVETNTAAKTVTAGSLPLPRSEALAAISENNHLILLPWYNLGTAPQGAWVPGYMKLVTPIVQNESNMFSIKIKGYRYGSGASLEIRCGGYAYSGQGLINSDCFTEGTSDPVGIGVENNKVIITIGSGGGQWYYDHFTAEYVGWTAKDPNDFNWAFVYNAAPATTNTHNVIIKDSAGTVTTTGSVGIGTASPNARLEVAGGNGYDVILNAGNSGSLRWGNGAQAALSWDTGKAIIYGLSGNDLSFGASGSYDQLLIKSGGNVGIGTTSPGAKLSFADLNDGRNTADGITWYNPGPTLYGIYRTAGSWAAPNYQQLALAWQTGVVIDGGSGYGRSGTVIQPNGGNVGIGTPSPGDYKLSVNGNTNVTGNITATGSIAAKYQDVAEWVPASEQLSAGTVVVLDVAKSNQVTSSSVSYDTRVAGIVSEQPGIALGEKGDGKVLVATTGRVRVKVDASKGPIHIGDLLVTSEVPGVAMKSEPVNLGGVQFHRPGTLIGKALEPLEQGKGEILVLLSLQ